METTDPQDELFYLVDDKDNILGSITRAEAHRSPEKIHCAIEVLIFDDQDYLLIQQRSATKDTDPLCFSLSTGGHVRYGDEYLDSVIREVAEEIGLTLSKEEFTKIGVQLEKDAMDRTFLCKTQFINNLLII